MLKKQRLIVVLLTLFIMSSPMVAAPGTQTIVYPKESSAIDLKANYPVELLKLALQHSKTPYSIVPSRFEMSQARALKNLLEKKELHVVWTMTNKQREAELLPIRIPIYKGLFGWRLFLISKNQFENFSSFESISQIKRLRAIQGHDWPDTQILKDANFNVITSAEYASRFQLLKLGRADYFPRSVLEIWTELEAFGENTVVVEPKWALHYLTAVYFFVHKENALLANDITSGLEAIIANGNFENLFLSHHQLVIERAALENRHIVTISQMDMPISLPLHRPELWYHPKTQKRVTP